MILLFRHVYLPIPYLPFQMSFLEFLWVLFVALCFVALLVNVCNSDSRGRDDGPLCCAFVGLVVAGFILVAHIHSAVIGPQPTFAEKHPTTFFMWNRSTRQTSKAGWQITDYRKPDPHLPPNEYMMGVELARSNACHQFDFSKDVDIDRFQRCAHFFPEFKTHYQQHLEERVGICLP